MHLKLVANAHQCGAAPVFHDRLRYLLDRKDEINGARKHRAARHPFESGFLGILDDNETVMFLYRFKSEAAVRARSGKDHANGGLSPVFRQTAQQMPVSAGSALTSFLHASRPPAEAPMPAIGNFIALSWDFSKSSTTSTEGV
jgi:hypothetical protein